MRWVLVLFILIAPITMSFIFFKSQPRDYADIAREIRGKVCSKLVKKHNMNLSGVTGGMMGSVYLIGLMFNIRHKMDQNEARARLVDCVEELINTVNDNVEIRPFLKNYPFTTKNVKIAIFITNSDGRDVYDPDISVVSLCESNTIHFYTNEPQSNRYKNEYLENYAEALAFVNASKQCNQVNQREATLDSAKETSRSRNTCE